MNNVVLLIFKAEVRSAAQRYFCTVKTTVWFVLNIIVLILIGLITVIAIFNERQLETDLSAFLTGIAHGNTESMLNSISAAVNQISRKVTQIAGDEAEEKTDQPEEEKREIFCCPQCGNAVEPGSKFCTVCAAVLAEATPAEVKAVLEEEHEEKTCFVKIVEPKMQTAQSFAKSADNH